MSKREIKQFQEAIVENRHKFPQGEGIKARSTSYPEEIEHDARIPSNLNPRQKRARLAKLPLILLGLSLYAGIGSKLDRVYAEETTQNPTQEFIDYTQKWEGMREWIYDDATGKRLLPGQKDKGNRTIGSGFNMERAGAKEDFERILPQRDFERVFKGYEKITDAEADLLMKEDINDAAKDAKRYFPNFDTYSLDMKKALVDTCYRGSMNDSPNTRKLIRNEDYAKAAVEFLKRKDVKNAIQNNMSGLIKREQTNAGAIARERNKR